MLKIQYRPVFGLEQFVQTCVYAVPEKLEWSFAPIVKLGGMCFVTGWSGHGKTNLVGEMALGIAYFYQDVVRSWNGSDCEPPDFGGAGLPIIEEKDIPAWKDMVICGGAFKVGREGLGQVLIIDGENSVSTWNAIFDKILNAYTDGRNRVDPADPLWARVGRWIHHVNHEVSGLMNPETASHAASEIAQYCVRKGIKLVIADPALTVFSPEDSAGDMWVNYQVRPLRNALHTAGVSLIMITHPPGSANIAKPPKRTVDPIGSKQQRATADTSVFVFRDGTQNLVTLMAGKTRGIDHMIDDRSKCVIKDLGVKGAGYEPQSAEYTDWEFENPGVNRNQLSGARLEAYKGVPLNAEMHWKIADMTSDQWRFPISNSMGQKSRESCVKRWVELGYVKKLFKIKSAPGQPMAYGITEAGVDAHKSAWPDQHE